MIPLLGLALAAAPDHVDLDDHDRWEAGAKAFTRGPTGCWELTGQLELRLLHDTGASTFGAASQTDRSVRGRVTARFEDHRWTRFHHTLDAPREPWMVARPFWGKVADDAIQVVDDDGQVIPPPEPTGFLARMSQARRPRRGGAADLGVDGDAVERALTVASFQYLGWDDAERAVLLTEEANLEGVGRGKVVSVFHFPEGGPVATALDLQVPGNLTIGTWPLQGTVTDAAVHIRGAPVGDAVLPLAQRFSGVGGFFGQTFGVDSLLTFTEARRCAAPPTPAPPATDAAPPPAP